MRDSRLIAADEAEAEAARRTLRALGYTYTPGAENWRPPLGPHPSPLLARIAELEAALRQIADGDVDEGGNRRPRSDSILIAKDALDAKN